MDKPQSFIHDLVDDHKGSVETPISWLYWSLITCISAAAANNFFIRSFKGTVLYYPNVYVMLLGESGLGKGYGINLAKRLTQKADITRVIAGRSSIQGILKELATTKSVHGKPVITDSRGYIINGELSTAIISDPDSLTILTDLFDRNYNPEWTNLLKGDGPEKLKDPYITCLFGSSPAHFYDSVPQANIEGGYIGRNLIIYEERRAENLDSLDSEDDKEIDDDKFENIFAPKYSPHLVKISRYPKTRLIVDEPARILYNSWKKEWRATQHIYNDKTGFITRVPDHVLKVSMCLSLSYFDFDGTVKECNMKEAIEQVTSLVYANQRTSEATGIDPLAQQTKKAIDILLASENQELSRRAMLIEGYGNFDSAALDRIIDTLMEMRWIKREKIGVGKESDWLIKLAGEPLERYKKFKERQKK